MFWKWERMWVRARQSNRKCFFIFNPLSIAKVTNYFVLGCFKNRSMLGFTSKLMRISSNIGNAYFPLNHSQGIEIIWFSILWLITSLYYLSFIFPSNSLSPHNFSNFEVIIFKYCPYFAKLYLPSSLNGQTKTRNPWLRQNVGILARVRSNFRKNFGFHVV